jgi:hypothetical protein
MRLSIYKILILFHRGLLALPLNSWIVHNFPVLKHLVNLAVWEIIVFLLLTFCWVWNRLLRGSLEEPFKVFFLGWEDFDAWVGERHADRGGTSVATRDLGGSERPYSWDWGLFYSSLDWGLFFWGLNYRWLIILLALVKVNRLLHFIHFLR